MEASGSPRGAAALRRALPVLACATGFFVHLFVVREFAVDVPFVDEWDELRPGALPAGWDPGYLLGLHNEHRITTTRVLQLLLLRWNGWDLAFQQSLNFLVFGALLGLLVAFAARLGPALPSGASWGFALLLLSPISHQNHAWPFQVQIHLAWLFAFASLLLLFGSAATKGRAALGVAAAVLAMWSFSSGVVFAAVLAACLLASALLGAPGARRPALAAAAALGLGLALWFVGYRSSPHAPVLSWPDGAAFWDYLFNLASWGFGFSTVSAPLGAACLLAALAPSGAELVAARGRLSRPGWGRLAATLAVVGSLALIAVGRAAFGIPTAKTSRFAEIAGLLVPLAALHWSALLVRPRARAAAVWGLWGLAAIGLADDWTLSGYERMRRLKRQGVECVTQAFWSGGPAVCPTVYDLGPLSAEMLDAARRLRLSFYRTAERRLQDAGAGPR